MSTAVSCGIVKYKMGILKQWVGTAADYDENYGMT